LKEREITTKKRTVISNLSDFVTGGAIEKLTRKEEEHGGRVTKGI